MAEFRDNSGRTWRVSLAVPDLKPLRAIGVEVGKLLDANMKGLAALLDDPELLVAALFVLCSGQAEKAGVSEEDFGRAMGGDSLDHGSDAFVEALADFSRSQSRAVIRALAAKTKAVMGLVSQEALQELAKLDPTELTQLILRGASISSSSATSSPESSESTPAPGG